MVVVVVRGGIYVTTDLQIFCNTIMTRPFDAAPKGGIGIQDTGEFCFYYVVSTMVIQTKSCTTGRMDSPNTDNVMLIAQKDLDTKLDILLPVPFHSNCSPFPSSPSFFFS